MATRPHTPPMRETGIDVEKAATTRTFSLIASQNGVQAGLADIRAFLACAGISDDDCGTAEILLAEALNNVVEHACGMIDAGFVTVTIERRGNAAAIDIIDAGAPLPGLRPPLGHPPALEGPDGGLPEGGFGWFLIRNLTSGLTYTRRRGQNHLRLYLKLSA